MTVSENDTIVTLTITLDEPKSNFSRLDAELRPKLPLDPRSIVGRKPAEPLEKRPVLLEILFRFQPFFRRKLGKPVPLLVSMNEAVAEIAQSQGV